MIPVDQRPTGRPDTAPRGPAGPRPEPTGPKNPTPKPGTQKPPPASPKGGTGGPWPSTPGPSAPGGPSGPGRLVAELDTADLLLRSIGVLDLPGMDPADRMQLAHGLTVARRAIAGAQSPARRDLSDQARSAVATSGVPGPAGRPPLPGGDTFALPESLGLPSFEALLNR